MTWAQLDDGWYDHPSFAALSLAALGLWSAGTAYCNRHLTDGAIPRAFINRWGAEGRRAAAELVRGGRWEESERGWSHVGYLDHNPARAEVVERREAERSRKASAGRQGGLRSGELRRSRPPPSGEAEAKQPASLQLPPSEARAALSFRSPLLSSPLLSTEESNLDPALEGLSTASADAEPAAADDPSDSGIPPSESETRISANQLAYQAAYERGIARAKGSPFVMPAQQRPDLHTALRAFAKSETTGKHLRGETLLGWVEAAADDFVRAVLELAKTKPDAVGWYSSFGPKGFLKFLNEDTARAEARRVG